jgi:broad specificity phosphatase PhoE
MKSYLAKGFLACLMLVLAACATAPTAPAPTTVTFVVVRHAEKASDDARDPSLSAAGHTRALALAHLLTDAPLQSAYATAYRRTQQTAQPAAEAHGLVIATYDAQSDPAAFAARLRATHASGTVLVVGHSNTLPDIIAALSGQAIGPIADDQYDLIYRVRIAPGGTATLELERY